MRGKPKKTQSSSLKRGILLQQQSMEINGCFIDILPAQPSLRQRRCFAAHRAAAADWQMAGSLTRCCQHEYTSMHQRRWCCDPSAVPEPVVSGAASLETWPEDWRGTASSEGWPQDGQHAHGKALEPEMLLGHIAVLGKVPCARAQSLGGADPRTSEAACA